MGFSIGGLISGAAKAVGTALAFSPDPVLRIGGAALTGAFAAPVRAPSGSVTPAVLQQTRTGINVPAMLGFGLSGALTVAELLKESRQNTGRPASSKKIRASVKVCGITLTAEAFGLSESQICTIAVQTGRRRARGISAADLRRTRSTIRKVSSIRKSLVALAGRK